MVLYKNTSESYFLVNLSWVTFIKCIVRLTSWIWSIFQENKIINWHYFSIYLFFVPLNYLMKVVLTLSHKTTLVGGYNVKLIRILMQERYSSKEGSDRFPLEIKLKIMGTIPSAATPSHSFAENVVTRSTIINKKR